MSLNDNFAVLEQFECKASEDSVKTDLELTCTKCGEHICDVEAGDTLDVLARTAESHLGFCTGEEGQDRESYTDTQDRDSYTTED